MSFAANGEIRICYDTIGYPEDPPLLLIAGLGNQLVTWQDEFCASLIDRGFFVIRFDNRDCGLSSVVTDRDALAQGEWRRLVIQSEGKKCHECKQLL